MGGQLGLVTEPLRAASHITPNRSVGVCVVWLAVLAVDQSFYGCASLKQGGVCEEAMKVIPQAPRSTAQRSAT